MDQDNGLRQGIRSCNTMKESDAVLMLLPEPSQKRRVYEQKHNDKYKREGAACAVGKGRSLISVIVLDECREKCNPS